MAPRAIPNRLAWWEVEAFELEKESRHYATGKSTGVGTFRN